MKKRKLVIFGTGDIAQIASCYFDSDSDYEVCAFTVNSEFATTDNFENRPVIAFENVEKNYPPNDYYMFIATSYAKMNHVRRKILDNAKAKGYKIASYISSHCTYLSKYSPGENAFIFEDNTIQPFVKIGSNVTIWSGNHIGHHSEISDDNFISSHVVISGHCTIQPNCFMGVNSTIANNVIIANDTLVGAGAVISKDTEAFGVYVANRPTKLSKQSSEIEL